MTAQIFDFTEKSQLAWHHIAIAVRKAALERSGSREIADRVVETVRHAYERSVPAKLNLQLEPTQSRPVVDLSPFIRTHPKERPQLLDEHVQIFSDHLHKIVGALVAELTVIATDAEMLAANHEPHNHRDR